MVEIREILEEKNMTRDNQAIWMLSYTMNARN
jgi:hypothetical protein